MAGILFLRLKLPFLLAVVVASVIVDIPLNFVPVQLIKHLSFPFLNEDLKQELSCYPTLLCGVSSEIDKLEWWRKHTNIVQQHVN